ncbi:MAG TPA: hypothetical protein VHE12_02060 [bacterium]|nr:hypothetical protein [bacterium]
MFSSVKRISFYLVAGISLFLAGWACSRFSNPAGISDDTVVAVVGSTQITFKDWMRQMDLLRVFATPIDPDNKDQVKAVLDSLIDQQVVLLAAQKDNYSSGAFDEAMKKKLLEADLKIKELKDKLQKDMDTLHRIEGHYQDPYKKMLLARQYANSKVGGVVVTDKDLRDWYDDYSQQAMAAGQKMPPYSKVSQKVKDEKIKPALQAEKFIKQLQDATKIERKNDVIDKYLASLSMSAKMLGSDNNPMPMGAKDDGKK